MPVPTHTVRLTVAPEHAMLRLDAYLAELLPWRSRRSLVQLLSRGAIEVNGQRAKKARRLAAGDVVALELPRSPEEIAVDLGAIPLSLVYEDDDLVVVDKPGDLAVHPASTCQHRNLLRRLEHHYSQVRAQTQPDSRVEPCVLHRLDRTTSGVVAFAKRRALIDVYTRQFAARTTTKEYVAIVHGRLEGPRTIATPIHVPPDRPVIVGPGGKPSRTEVRVVAYAGRTDGEATLVAITLRTGRKHQIRAHLAAEGHPLLYDAIYGPSRPEDDTPEAWPSDARPMLHATRLELDHRDGRRLAFEAPLPDDLRRTWDRLRRAAAPRP